MRIVVLILLMIFGITSSTSACRINFGQAYEYEWTIVDASTGAVVSQGKGEITPTRPLARGHRNMETYVRANGVDGWDVKAWSRTVAGVRQRLTVKILNGDDHGH